MILIVLLFMTRSQVGYWKDNESLFKHAIDVTTNNYIMHNTYGEVLRHKGRLDEAIENFRQALAANPGWVDTHEKLAGVLHEKGLDAEAMSEFELVLRARPDKIETRNAYGQTLVKLKQYNKAFEQFNIVLTADPCRISALNNLYEAGVESGKLDKVLDVLWGLQIKDPNNFEFCQKAGLIYGLQGNVDAAIEQLEKACRLSDYQAAEPLAFLSQAYAAKKDMKRAIETARKAIELAQKQGKEDVAAQVRAGLESYQREMKGN
jgi:tetratricopeptide (TPR) repeat protein